MSPQMPPVGVLVPLPPWGSWSCWGETGCQPSGLGRWLIPPGLQVPIPKLFPTWGMRHPAGNLTAFHIMSCRKRLVWELGKGWCAGVALTPSFQGMEVPLFDRGPLCLWPRPLPLSASHAGSEPWEAEPALSCVVGEDLLGGKQHTWAGPRGWFFDYH